MLIERLVKRTLSPSSTRDAEAERRATGGNTRSRIAIDSVAVLLPAEFEAVSVTTQPTFAFGNAMAVPKLFLMAGAGLRTPYDITPDGRIVGRITAGQMEYARSQNDQIQIVLNWFEDLRARVPTR